VIAHVQRRERVAESLAWSIGRRVLGMQQEGLGPSLIWRALSEGLAALVRSNRKSLKVLTRQCWETFWGDHCV
jgi:hypothetical protein